MPSAVIISEQSKGKLELSIAADHGPYDARWSVKLETPSVVATHEFWGSEPQHLVAFFDGLAASWRGWDGQREWTEVERDLSLVATHDGLGHVVLGVTLGTTFVSPPADSWLVRAPLKFDAGALDRLATQAHLLLADDRA